jgi:hypothetical protein
MREMGGLWHRIAYLPAISLFFAGVWACRAPVTSSASS